MDKSTIQALVTILIIGVVLALRMRTLTRERPLKLEQLWIVPGIYLIIAGLFFYAQPPQGLAWAWCVVALAIGAMLGWQRGRLMHISVDPATQTLRQKGSLASMLFLLGLIAVRTAAREAAIFHFGGIHFDVNLVTQLLVALALGLLSVQRIEMYLRARKLLEIARPA
jgi:membrane protein CcdC involved in cytochrome C biogenesis